MTFDGESAVPINIQASPERSWTIAVFMVGGAELGPALSRDLVELERVGSNGKVSVVVSRSETPRSRAEWFEIPPRKADGPTKRKSIGQSTTNTLDERLAEFLTMTANDYPARHVLLIMWGHASGLMFGELKPGSERDELRLQEIAALLRGLRQLRGRRLDILGFCACALSKAEFALELRDEVDYLVSSQVGISTLMTWPFDDIVQLATSNPSIEAGQFARQLVHVFEEQYEPPPVGLTALDLRKSEEVGTFVHGLSQRILISFDQPGEIGRMNNLCVLQAFTEALDAHPYHHEPTVDFFDLCRKLVQQEHLDVDVRAQAQEVLNNGFQSFVVENARSGPKMGALHGLSILAPDFDDPDFGDTCKKCSKESSKSYLSTSTDWAQVVARVHSFGITELKLAAE
jgi:hypothetical protein